MRNGFRVTALGAGFLLAGLGMGQVAQAGTLELDRDSDGTNAYQGRFGGGEYLVDVYTSDGSPGDASCFPPHPFGGYDAGGDLQARGSIFQTFCLELDENLDFQNPMDWECNTEAIAGGNNTDAGDPLSSETAYLYSRFYRGILSDYNYDQLGEDDADNTVYNETRGESATALQLAIWFLEDELNGPEDQAIIDAYNANQQAQDWVAEAQANADGTIGRVRVLNLTQIRDGQTLRQDVLVLTAIPLPPAAFLGLGLMSALGGMEFIRRRRRQLS